MVTKTIFARAARLKSRVSTVQNAPSPAPKTGVQQSTLATQSPPTSLSPSAIVAISPPVGGAPAARQHQRASRTSQTPSQPPATNFQKQSCPPVSISAQSRPQIASTSSPQTQSCAPISTSAPSQPLSPILSTPAPQTQSSSSITASTPPQSPNASTPGLQPQLSSSTLASTPPWPPNPSTISPQTQSCASSSGPRPPQTSSPGLQGHPCTPNQNSSQCQTPAAGIASPQKQSPLSTLASGLWAAVQRNWKSLLGGCITVALAIAGVYLSGLYGKVTLKYTRWTQHNDFRDGCITDRDHNLTLAEECFAELARPRVSAVYVKRHLDAVQDAYLDNALYWTVAICIPVLTCVFCLVWLRTFARDGPRPVISLVKMDFSNSGQVQHGNGNAVTTQIDEDVSDLSHVQDHKAHDPVQQAQVDAPPSDAGSDEDYFQVWKDRIKTHQEGVRDIMDILDTSSLHHSSYAGSMVAHWSDSRRASVSSLRDLVEPVRILKDGTQNPEPPANETSESDLFEVRFEPSGNYAKCQQVVLDLPTFKFHPTDGVKLEVERNAERSAEFVLKLPFERGATALQLVDHGYPYTDPTTDMSWIPKRAIWARRLALPSHRFIYLVVRDKTP